MPKNIILGPDQIRRVLARISHEILERTGGAEAVILVGLHTRGVPLARRLSQKIGEIAGKSPPTGIIDAGLYRDDLSGRMNSLVRPTDIPLAIDGRQVILVDDVLYTGRTIRAAMDAITDFGRPSHVQLAVLIDRGHRELPIKPDYVGKNVPTSLCEHIKVHVSEVDGMDEVVLVMGNKHASTHSS